MDPSGTRRPAAGPAAFVRIAAVCALVGWAAWGCGQPPPRPSAATPPAPASPAAPPSAEAPAPPTAPDPGETFYPHKAGTAWTMEARAGAEKWTLDLKVAADIAVAPAEPAAPDAITPPTVASEAPPAAQTWSVETRRDGEVAQVERYRADATGVYLVGFGPDGSGRIEPPMPVLKMPFEVGATWKWQGVFVDGDARTPGEAEFTLKAPQPLRVPAARYAEAYCVEQRFLVGGLEAPTVRISRQWLVPGVGMVQQETIDDSQAMTARLLKFAAAP